jgi:cytochrome b6-f complex iron-sulfur subunit
MADQTKPRRVKRRDFLRLSLGAGTAGALGAFGAASLGFLWPRLGEGFGAVMDIGSAEDILDEVLDTRAPFRHQAGKMYVIAWEPGVRGAEEQYGDEHPSINGMGLMALYQHCPHLGCVVPWCQPSQWFECPCHGSKYNRWGEWQEGPAARGMDRFPSEIVDGRLMVDTGVVVVGPSRTADVLAQDPEGPHCIDI